MKTDDRELFQQEELGINIKRYLYKIIYNWPFFIVSLIIAFSIGYLVVRYTEPIYKVSTTMLINDDPRGIEAIYLFAGRNISQKNIQNEITTLKSYTITQKTISQLDFLVSYVLVGRVKETKIFQPFFKIVLDTTRTNIAYLPVYLTFIDNDNIVIEIDYKKKIKKTIRFGEKFENDIFSFTIQKIYDFNRKIIDQRIPFYFYVNDLEQLIRVYRQKLQISADEKKSSVLTLSIVGPIPEQEVVFLNKLTEVYIQNHLDEKNKASENVIKFIDIQLAKISDSLAIVERKLQDFRNENKIFDIKQAENFSTIRLNELQNEKFANELKLRYCSYIRDYLAKKAEFNDIIAPSTFGINDNNLNAAINELISLFNEKKLISVSLTENNPNFIVIETRINNAKKLLLESITELENSLKYSIKIGNEAIAKEESKLFKLPPVERKLLALQREYEINNNIFSFLLQKRAEAGITRASNTADQKILDRAQTENAILIKPNRSKIYTTSLILGLLIPLGIILLIEFLNNKITEVRVVTRLKKANFIGSVGHNNKDSDIPVFEYPRSALAESFRGLRSNLNHLMRNQNEKIILITSTISGEGKTFCSVNLSTIIAMSNKSVLLASLDLRKPKLHHYFNLSNNNGISNYLIDQVNLNDIILPTNINNLYFIPSGPVPPNPAELLETERMKQLVEYLRQRFDYIIFDSPPIAIVSDAIILSDYADATLYVARYNFSSRDVLDLADELAERQQLKRVYVLINDVKTPGYYGYSSYYASRYGYSYHYNYGYSYYAYGSDYYTDEERPKTLKDKIKAWLGV